MGLVRADFMGFSVPAHGLSLVDILARIVCSSPLVEVSEIFAFEFMLATIAEVDLVTILGGAGGTPTALIV